ncbi:MAG: hypothetical protein AB7K09_05530 [Planctomycetota bacterium]
MPHVRLDVTEAPTAEGINGEMQALYIALKHAGENVQFATLMGIGGLAFRLYWHVGKADDDSLGWSESSLEACGGMHPLYMACQWIGWNYESFPSNTLDAFYDHARKSIDNGVPALTRGPGGPEPGLIVGYEEEGTRKLDFLGKYAGQITSLEIPMFDLPLLDFGHWRNPVFIVERGEPVAPEMKPMLLQEAFARCAEVLNQPDIDDGRWVGGVQCYDLIANDLDDRARLDQVIPGVEGESDDDDRVYLLSDWLSELGRARGTAFEFLDTYADDYPIEPVARGYETVYEKYQELREIFPDARKDAEGAHKAFFNDDTRKDISRLLREMGKAEAAAATTMQKKLDKIMEAAFAADDFAGDAPPEGGGGDLGDLPSDAGTEPPADGDAG